MDQAFSPCSFKRLQVLRISLNIQAENSEGDRHNHHSQWLKHYDAARESPLPPRSEEIPEWFPTFFNWAWEENLEFTCRIHFHDDFKLRWGPVDFEAPNVYLIDYP